MSHTGSKVRLLLGMLLVGMLAITSLAASSPLSRATIPEAGPDLSGEWGDASWSLTISTNTVTIKGSKDPKNPYVLNTPVPKSFSTDMDASEWGSPPWKGPRNKFGLPVWYIEKIVFENPSGIAFPKDSFGLFEGLTHLTEIEGISEIDTSQVVDMQDIFKGCVSLRSLDLSGWDMSKVSDTDSMFSDTNSLIKLVLGPKTILGEKTDLGLGEENIMVTDGLYWQRVGEGTISDPRSEGLTSPELVSLTKTGKITSSETFELRKPSPQSLCAPKKASSLIPWFWAGGGFLALGGVLTGVLFFQKRRSGV